MKGRLAAKSPRAGSVLPDAPSALFTLFSSLGSLGAPEGDQRVRPAESCRYPAGLPAAAHVIPRKGADPFKPAGLTWPSLHLYQFPGAAITKCHK